MDITTFSALRDIASSVMPKTHKIVRGDNLWNLDKKYGLPRGSFAKLNKVDPTRLRPGQELIVPYPLPPKPKPPKYLGPTEKTMRIIRRIESKDGKKLKGDWKDASGKYHSSGEYQIREVYPTELEKYRKNRAGKAASYSMSIDEVNDRFGTDYVLDDRDDPVKARDIASKYMYILGNRFSATHGRLPTEAEVARMYNGGIGGMNSEKAVNYGKKFDRLSVGPRLVKPSPWQTSGYIKAFDEMRLLDPTYESKMKALRDFDKKKREAYEASGAIVNK